MLDRVIGQADLRELVDALARKRRIVGPVRRSVPEADPPERFFYQEVSRADQLDLAFTHCVFSPKAQLFPAHESLFSFDQNQGGGGGIGGGFTAEPIFDDRPLALVGVHPCDINAIRLLDTVFSQGTRDEHYLRRRANTLIVGIDCAKPCTEGVFCKDMQTNVADDGFDVMLYPLSDAANGDVRYGVVYGTAAGKEWIQYSRCGSVASAEDEQALVAFTQSKSSAFTNALSTPLEALPALLDRSYDSLLWEATARRCYSCGSCNLVCPTCYCFNMYDEVDMTLQAGERRREWDGCQIRDFALVAGDHNFRPKSASRLRHRIYRKAKWVKEHSGVTGCVGCARCDRACTAKISSVEIFNQLAEEV